MKSVTIRLKRSIAGSSYDAWSESHCMGCAAWSIPLRTLERTIASVWQRMGKHDKLLTISSHGRKPSVSCCPMFIPLSFQQPSSMAYNREWDQGKESWNDSAWHATSVGAHVRPREEDYYGEGKRRKFNNGVCSQL